MRDDASDTGILDGGARPPAGEHIMRAAIMIGLPMSHGSNDANLVRDLGCLLEHFGEINAIELRFHCSQWPPIFNGRERFRIERFLRGNSTGQEDVDDGLGAGFWAGCLGLEFEQVPQGQPDTSDQTDEDKLAPVGPPNMIRAAAERRMIL